MKRPANKTLPLPFNVDPGDSPSQLIDLEWPDLERFPLNTKQGHVEDLVVSDLRSSDSPLIVTGYASLDKLIDHIADCRAESKVRIIIGCEPFDSRRESYRHGEDALVKEMEDYWLERGISLLLSAKLLTCIDRIKKGSVHSRYLAGSTRLHAKIYIGDDAATLGSSNFTYPGLFGQHEANVRFSKAKEKKRYGEACRIAENFWQMGRDYNDRLLELLEKLLQVVSWQEALARACAELLEGEWANEYLDRELLGDEAALWPSQKKGIAQALQILDQQGSVLIADATGAGKTRMGAHLIGAVRDHIVRSNRLRHGTALMVCPPMVMKSWEREKVFCSTALDVRSHGVLSHAKSRGHDLTIDALRRAQILCIDEGHNFLNLGSSRTRHLLRNMADHVLLFTATPINKSAADLLRIANMLGGDNLDDDVIDAFTTMLGSQNLNRPLTDDEVTILRRQIDRFTVRRTKRVLNKMVDEEPEKYRDYRGELCRYPKHNAEIYYLNESPRDRKLAKEISGLAVELFAVTHFKKPIELPGILKKQGVSEEQYLQRRLHSAKMLAHYLIMSCLRSSRSALAEHIVGTKEAVEQFSLQGFSKQNETGNALLKIQEMAGSVPENRLSIELPDWLSDPVAHEQACRHDAEIYRQIYQRVKEMSAGRELTKARHLLKMLLKHDLVLAFDSRLISLEAIKRMIHEQSPNIKTMIATGEDERAKERLVDVFKPGSNKKKIIGLCSDSLSEGVNLQQASAVALLDMPSVVRIAEQRVGRVDRMDSPHKSIDVWWPEDAEEFAVSSDERFIERLETVANLLGSNMPLPVEKAQKQGVAVKAREFIEEYERSTEISSWDGITDAYEPVRRLVEGDDALVEGDVYERYKKVTARVLSRVSLVRSKKPWAFFCISAGSFAAPRWLMLPSDSGRPIYDFGGIANALRERLDASVEKMELDAKAVKFLNQFIMRLNAAERSMLPRRKQRALEEMEQVLSAYIKKSSNERNQARMDSYQSIYDGINAPLPESQPNWDEIASRWIDLIRPVWHEKIRSDKNKLFLMRDIRKALIAREGEIGEKLLNLFDDIPRQRKPEERIKACIIGVPS